MWWGCIASGLLAIIGSAQAADAPLDFRRTFDAPARPVSVNYVAEYRIGSNPATHHLEVWRDGDRRIRRRTDDAIESYVERPANDTEWTITVLDLKRRIRTDVDRSNLMRIGYLDDWFSQTHALQVPRGDYRLVAEKVRAVRAGTATPVAPCRWYVFDQPERRSRICWSDTARIPLLIEDGNGNVVWRVERLATRPLGDDVFRIADTGFVRNDANADIQPD